jgi:hypothetical protein
MVLDLRKDYEVKYNTGLRLITIRHYTNESIENLPGEPKFILSSTAGEQPKLP